MPKNKKKEKAVRPEREVNLFSKTPPKKNKKKNKSMKYITNKNKWYQTLQVQCNNIKLLNCKSFFVIQFHVVVIL